LGTAPGAAVLVALAMRRWLFEPQAPVSERLTDPVSIAYLRAGPREGLRLAALARIAVLALRLRERPRYFFLLFFGGVLGSSPLSG
jgi:hypothetical protein